MPHGGFQGSLRDGILEIHVDLGKGVFGSNGDGQERHGPIRQDHFARRSAERQKIAWLYIKEAKRLNDEGIQKASKPKAKGPRELAVPTELTAALKKNKKASSDV